MSWSGNKSLFKTRTKDKDEEKTAKVVGEVAGIAFVWWGVSKLFSGSKSKTSTNKKTMKAPGRDKRIYRDDFEEDPATYFRNLRNKKDEETTGIAKVVRAVAGIALVGWGVAMLFSGSESETSTNRKTKKSSGKRRLFN